jgi:branched-chain amino acid transport system substrate-binding protein
MISLMMLAIVIAAGCGDDDTDGNGGGSTIKLGLLLPYTGSLESNAKSMRKAAELALAEINDAGGVLGKKLEFVNGDSALDTKTASENLKNLISKGVVAVIGPVASGVSMGVYDEVLKNETDPVPILVTGTSPAISDYENKNVIWRCMPSDKFQGATGADWAIKQSKTKASIIYRDNAWGQKLAEAFKTAFTPPGSSNTIVGETKYPDQESYDTYDFSTNVTDLFPECPDIVYIASYSDDGAKFTTAAKAQVTASCTPLFFGTDAVYSSTFLANGDPDVLKTMEGTAPTPSVDKWAQFKTYVDAYKAKNGTVPEAYADGAYDAVYLYALAMEKGKKADAATIKANLQGVSKGGDKIGPGEWKKALEAIKGGKDVDYDGASGPVEWDANGDITDMFYDIWQIVDEGGKLSFKSKDNIRLQP